jgi:hypothetical protein
MEEWGMEGWNDGRMENWKNGYEKADLSPNIPIFQDSDFPPFALSNIPAFQDSIIPIFPSMRG